MSAFDGFNLTMECGKNVKVTPKKYSLFFVVVASLTFSDMTEYVILINDARHFSIYRSKWGEGC